MLVIDFIDEQNQATPSMVELIEKILQFTAQAEGILQPTELSVSFLTDEEIRAVNATYRGIDRSTDVISFALEEEGEGELAIVPIQEQPRHLGDLLISVDTASRQAVEYGHSLERELGFLALHGFLHLVGYDHETAEQEKEMFGRQKNILQKLGLGREI